MADTSTEERAGERAVEQLYPLILDSIHEGVFTVDADFRLTSFNAEAERISGVPREEAIGRRCYEVFRASICQTRCALMQTLETGEPLRDVRIDVLDRAMRAVPICVSTAVLLDEGRLVGAVEIFRDVSDVESLRQELHGQKGFADIIGTSPAMLAVFRILPDVAASDASVLVEGPSGTGKELVAQAIHQLSARRDGPFVRVNCAALPDALLESELFGYVKGAFTDARRDKPGRFSLAHGGTILLDEIGDVSPAFQAKLLRVLQEGEIQPLGSTRTLNVDVRVVAATNRDLGQMVREGRFREDLYYRIRVVPISLPALRERRGDIPLLVDHFVGRLAAKTGKQIREVAPGALTALRDYDYPGNVRELENVLERAFVLCHGQRIELAHLPEEVVYGRAEPGAPPRTLSPSLPAPPPAPSTPEARSILEALEAHRWNRTEVARALGIGRNTLWRRMKRYGLLG